MSANATGLRVELAVEGDARGLSPGLDLTAYRLVQEALAGALEQGAADHARVVVRYRLDAVEVEVTDDGTRNGPRALVGVPERVGLYGGQLLAGRPAAAAMRSVPGCRWGRLVNALWRRLRAVRPATADHAFALFMLICSKAELLTQEPARRPGYSSAWSSWPATRGRLAWRRRHPLLIQAGAFGLVVSMRILLADPTDMLIPFVRRARPCPTPSGRTPTGGRRGPASRWVRARASGTVTVLADSDIVGDYIFPTAFGIILWLAGRAVRTRTRLTEELHEAAVLEREAHEHEAARRRGRGAPAHRRRDARRRRPQRQRDGGAGRRGAPHPGS